MLLPSYHKHLPRALLVESVRIGRLCFRLQFINTISQNAWENLSVKRVNSSLTGTSAVSKESSERGMLLLQQRASFLIEHGNWLKAEKQQGLIVDKVNAESGSTGKQIRWRALHQWWHLRIDGELQTATMTKRKTTHHANQHYKAYVKRPLRPFQPGMPVEQDFVGKQKADVRGLSSAAVSDVHYLWTHVDLMLFLKHKQEEEAEFCQYYFVRGCNDLSAE